MTGGFTHAVIRYDPNLSQEDFNIGIIIHDHSTNLVHWKFTKNTEYIKKMTVGAPDHKGISYIIDISFKDRDKVEKHEEHDYLEKLAEKERGIYQREWVEIKGGGVGGEPVETYIDQMYSYFVNMDHIAEQLKGATVFSYACIHRHGIKKGIECKICEEKSNMKGTHKFCSKCIDHHKEWHKKNV